MMGLIRTALMKQQDQTKIFFKGHASEWQKKATDHIYSVINDRHRAVHRTMARYPSGSSLLDVGCGTGQLAIELAANGHLALGIDFAEEMIDQAKINALNAKSSAEFQTVPIFDFHPTAQYHVISAMGFIEYISLDQLDYFLEFCRANTTADGSVAIGSRNRLFNLTTFNEYTEIENKLGTFNELLEEASICISSKHTEEFLNSMRSYIGSTNLIQNESHPITGIGVETRYQFTPGDLMRRVEGYGFKVTNIYSVNYHAFHPTIEAEKVVSLRKDIAEMVSAEYQSDFRHIPNSSSFVIEAQKV
jgi:2-polyprenyl-3-methyl-5-hydroxy-6-metoxy-1,4-benzoquinol methylase